MDSRTNEYHASRLRVAASWGLGWYGGPSVQDFGFFFVIFSFRSTKGQKYVEGSSFPKLLWDFYRLELDCWKGTLAQATDELRGSIILQPYPYSILLFPRAWQRAFQWRWSSAGMECYLIGWCDAGHGWIDVLKGCREVSNVGRSDISDNRMT